MTTKPTIDQLAAMDLHYLTEREDSEARATVRAVLRGDHEAAHAHAAESCRHRRAAELRVWRDGEAHTNGAEK